MTLSAWLREIAQTPPRPLTRREWVVACAATLAGAISRLVTLARAPWDWDELLFMLAVDRFDVAKHHPHPPGFPLFIGAAKLIHRLGADNFHALQAMSVLAAITIVPAMLVLCRELRMRFATAICAALLLAFFPNVWFFGGTAFSDVPSMTLIILVLALLLAGFRDTRAYLAAAALLGVAAGVRPQNLLIGFVPLLLASIVQLRRARCGTDTRVCAFDETAPGDSGPRLPPAQTGVSVPHSRVSVRRSRVPHVIAALCIIAFIVAAGYGTAASITGWARYAEAMRNHSRFIVSTDSFLAPHRRSMWKVFLEFFVKPYRAPAINALVTFFAVVSVSVSIIRRRWHILLALASFAPFCAFAWLMLDRLSTGRFSIGYAPLMALLAADGIRLVMRSDLAEAIAGTIVLAVMIAWVWPAFATLRGTVPPPAAAAGWIRQHVDPKTSAIYVDEAMDAAAQWYLPEYRRVPASPSVYQLREGRIGGAVTFAHPRGRLWKIVRRRYFEVSVVVPARPTS
jgi:hypothetical protein